MSFFLSNLVATNTTAAATSNISATQPNSCNVNINSEIDNASIVFDPTITSGTLQTGETIIGNNGMFVSGCCNKISYESAYTVNPKLA